ncbi:GSCFA domain-containing protein [Shimia abyssi]|uniref:GSCFA family protein n=1 Tax=Shimia abyssi TaxID=1662395 RepID=A0A2P8FEQ1_9RHOB|nr:GSCFA domain-containing protein [Shimia abyssi]PSL20201.1 GSCFA family protein [Shimia abyssi]
MTSFYSDLEERAFWKTGVADKSALALADLYRKKWDIQPDWKIGTAGSCFAQHIARHMRQNGYSVLDVEPAPMGLAPELHQSFGFGMYSGRYGNLYTTRQFRQLIASAFDKDPEPYLIWEKGGRFFDVMRPNIEPAGFESREEAVLARDYHLERLRELFLTADVFVFTMGLTEAWVHRESGRVVPLAPGVVAGEDVADEYVFENFSLEDVVSEFRAAMDLLRSVRRGQDMRFLLTVSPVPLTATATGQHVLAASTYSKAVLRTAAGQLCESHDTVDYFPSFEIITNPAARGTFFAPNLRSVLKEGVDVVMKTFFAAHPPQITELGTEAEPAPARNVDDVQCDEQMLEAFGR